MQNLSPEDSEARDVNHFSCVRKSACISPASKTTSNYKTRVCVTSTNKGRLQTPHRKTLGNMGNQTGSLLYIMHMHYPTVPLCRTCIEQCCLDLHCIKLQCVVSSGPSHIPWYHTEWHNEILNFILKHHRKSCDIVGILLVLKKKERPTCPFRSLT